MIRRWKAIQEVRRLNIPCAETEPVSSLCKCPYSPQRTQTNRDQHRRDVEVLIQCIREGLKDLNCNLLNISHIDAGHDMLVS